MDRIHSLSQKKCPSRMKATQATKTVWANNDESKGKILNYNID